MADKLLMTIVQCVQKLVKLILGLATEHRQQLLILSGRHLFRVDSFQLFNAENLGLIQSTEK